MARMPDGFIDLTVTSPPYDNLRDYHNDVSEKWGPAIWEPIIKDLYRVTKDGGVVVWVVGDATINGSETGTSFRQALWAMECGFNLHDTMIYQRPTLFPGNVRYSQDFEYMFVFSKGKPSTINIIRDRLNKNLGNLDKKKLTIRLKDGKTLSDKANGRIVGKYGERSNIWAIHAGYLISSPDKIAYEHHAIFPEKLAADHIYSWSNEGDLVYDPFMGSGTTAKMAHLQKRNWIGSELSQEFTDLAYKRLDPYLRQQRLF